MRLVNPTNLECGAAVGARIHGVKVEQDPPRPLVVAHGAQLQLGHPEEPVWRREDPAQQRHPVVATGDSE